MPRPNTSALFALFKVFRFSDQPTQVLLNIRRPVCSQGVKTATVFCVQGTGGFFKARPVARHRPHKLRGSVTGLANSVLAGVAFARLIHQPANGGGGAGWLPVQPFPVTRQQGGSRDTSRPTTPSFGRPGPVFLEGT